MIIKTLKQLQQPDEASLAFMPVGSGTATQAEDAADFHQEVIGRFDLSSQVPDTTRNSFERLRTIYAYGVLCYDLYTVAADQAYLVVEQALRDRFLPFYDGTAVFSDLSGVVHEVRTDKFDDLYQAIRKDGRLRPWKLQLRSGAEPIRFDGLLTSLLRWARAEGLLDGQRDRMRDAPRIRLRNVAAHPSYHLGTPPDAAAEIADLAAIINRLWGVSSGAPVSREVMAIGWDNRTVTWSPAERFRDSVLTEAATIVLVRANPEDDLACYDALFEATHHPCEFLWGPGTWPDAEAWLHRVRPDADEAATLDRLFVLRFHDSRLYLPQTATTAAGLDDAMKAGTWFLIRADSPTDAFNHQRQLLAGVAGHSSTGHCRCPVENVGKGEWREALSIAAAAGADVEPRHVPDIRVTISRMPRWNEILGGGNWSVPLLPHDQRHPET